VRLYGRLVQEVRRTVDSSNSDCMELAAAGATGTFDSAGATGTYATAGAIGTFDAADGPERVQRRSRGDVRRDRRQGPTGTFGAAGARGPRGRSARQVPGAHGDVRRGRRQGPTGTFGAAGATGTFDAAGATGMYAAAGAIGTFDAAGPQARSARPRRSARPWSVSGRHRWHHCWRRQVRVALSSR